MHPYIEDEQTTQLPKENVQKDKQRSTKHTHKTKDRVTRTPLKNEGELRCSGRVCSFCCSIFSFVFSVLLSVVGISIFSLIIIFTTSKGLQHIGAPEFSPVFSGVRVSQSLVFCVLYFVDHYLSVCLFSLDHYIIYPNSIDDFK